MLDRLLTSGMGLLGFCGVALCLFSVVGFDIERAQEVARVGTPVKARLLSKRLEPHALGRQSNKPTYLYTPVGAFEIVGAEGPVYEGVPLDDGTLRETEAEATQAAAQYREGMIVDAWFDPRSRDDRTYFPLTVTDPSAVAEAQRAQQRLLRWAGGGSLAASGLCALLLFRRSQGTVG